jgi:hypothetical protein
MKKLALLAFLSLCLVSAVYGMEKEPEGFAGIDWGTDIDTLNDMKLVQEKGEIRLYLRLNDKGSIEKAEARRADYFFYKDRLAAVRILFNGITSFNDLKLALTEEHGEAQCQNDLLNEFVWKGELVVIVFKYIETTKKGHIVYTYAPIATEWDVEQKAASKKPEKDLAGVGR